MPLQITSRDGSVERRIVIAMILSKSVLGRITSKWHGKMFRSSYANILGQLCVDFYKKHGDAPGKIIDPLFEAWCESQTDEGKCQEAGRLLSELGGEYKRLAKEINPDHTIDIAGEHFHMVKTEVLSQDLARYVAIKDYDKANKIVAAHKRLELGMGSGIDFFNDDEEQKAVNDEEDKDLLIQYPGALGEFFGYDFSRGNFAAFVGSAKSSKSFFLQDVAFRALCERRRVAYFEAGDLSKKQVERRFLVRASGHPYRSTLSRFPYWPCSVEYPIDMEVRDDAHSNKRRGFITQTETRTFDGPLDYPIAHKACENLINTHIKSKESYFKLSCHPNSTLTVDMIKASLEEWSLQGWNADVLIIDYADIMLPPFGTREERDGINKIWASLRSLNLLLNNLVVVATQADAESYGKETMTKKNFSGDRRKNDHVTSMYGINMTDDEKSRGICRLNLILRREGEYVQNKCVHIAQCLALGQPAVLSSF